LRHSREYGGVPQLFGVQPIKNGLRGRLRRQGYR